MKIFLISIVVFLLFYIPFSSEASQSCQLRKVDKQQNIKNYSLVTINVGDTSQRVLLDKGVNQIELICTLTKQKVLIIEGRDVLDVAVVNTNLVLEQLDIAKPAFLIPASTFNALIEIELYENSNIELSLVTVPELLHQTTVNFLTMGAFYGLCIVLILYVSFIGKIMSDKAFIFYGLYVFCASTFFLLQESHLTIFFPDKAYLLNHTLHIIFAGLTVLAATLFITRITDVYLTWPRLTTQVLYPLSFLVFFMSLYLAFFDGTELAFITNYVMAYFTLLIMIFVLSLISIQMINKVPLTGLVWSSLVIMIIGMLFRTFPFIENEFLVRYSLIFAFAIEALILAVVVSSRIENVKLDKLKAEIEADTDHLCEVLNRRGLSKRAKELIEKQKELGGILSILYIDLDGFKSVNDAHGHIIGDKVLNIVSKIINNQIRHTDILARVGGDEFVSIGHFETTSDAAFIADRIKRRFHSLVLQIDDELEVNLAASVGHVVFDSPMRSVNDMLQAADEKMYEKKKSRKAVTDISHN